MPLVPQKMVIGGYTFVTNPSADTDFHRAMQVSEFIPIGAKDSIIQVMGMKSGERTFSGYFLSDQAYRVLETKFIAAVSVPCTDWLGNAFTALITHLQPDFVNDIAHNFETRKYTMTLVKRPG